jgi:hypothetical protein
MAKWDINDGFWQMDCTDGEGWKFCVCPHTTGGRTNKTGGTYITANGMGQITPIFLCCHGNGQGRLHCHQIYQHASWDATSQHIQKVCYRQDYTALPKTSTPTTGFLYMVEVYVENFTSLVFPISQKQLQHVPTAVMAGMHDIFPPDTNDSNNPISKKKLLK